MSTYTYCKCKITIKIIQFSSVTKSYLTLCDPMGLQHARPPCPTPTPGAYSNSCPLSQGCHPTISSSVSPFSSFPQSFSFSSVQSLSRVQLCEHMDCSMPGLPVQHQLPELAQTHVHRVGDAIQLSHPLLSPSPPAFNLS